MAENESQKLRSAGTPIGFQPVERSVEGIAQALEEFRDLYLSHDHVIFGQSQKIPTNGIDLVDASTIAVNCALGSHFRVTLGGNRTLGNPVNARDGQRIIFEVIQDGTGSRTLAFDSKFVFGTTLPSITLSTTAADRDFIGCIYNAATDKFYVVSFADGY